MYLYLFYISFVCSEEVPGLITNKLDEKNRIKNRTGAFLTKLKERRGTRKEIQERAWHEETFFKRIAIKSTFVIYFFCFSVCKQQLLDQKSYSNRRLWVFRGFSWVANFDLSVCCTSHFSISHVLFEITGENWR